MNSGTNSFNINTGVAVTIDNNTLMMLFCLGLALIISYFLLHKFFA